MAFPLNPKFLNSNDVYARTTVQGLALKEVAGSESVVQNGNRYQGRRYKVYTTPVKHDFSWKFSRGIAAFFATVLSLGTLLCHKKVQTWWKEARTGVETRTLKVLTNDDELGTSTAKATAPFFSSETDPALSTAPPKEDAPIAKKMGPSIQEFNESEQEVLSRLLSIDLDTLKNNFPQKTAELHSLSKEQIESFLQDLTPTLLALFSQDQLLSLESDRLNDDQFKWMYSDKNRIQATKEGAFVSFLPRLADLVSSEVREFMTSKQVRSVDFSENGPVTQQIFAAIFEPIVLEPGTFKDHEAVGNMSAAQIVDCLNRGFFTSQTIQCIPDSKIRQFDNLPSIDWEKAGGTSVATALFLLQGNLNSLPVGDRLYDLIPHLEFSALNRLNQHQASSLDFAKEIFTRDVLTKMAIPHQGYTESVANVVYHTIPFVGKVIGFLTSDQVRTCLNRGLFTSETSLFITEAQIKGIDFAQIDLNKPECRDVIVPICSRHIQAVRSVEALHNLIPFLNPASLPSLSKDQVMVLDFSLPLFTNEILRSMANVGGHHAGRVISSLQPEQVVTCLNRGLFDADTAQFITGTIDITQVDIEKAGGNPVIEAMYFPYGTPRLNRRLKTVVTADALHRLIPWLNAEMLNSFSQTQIRLLDFSRDDIFTKSVFDEIFTTECQFQMFSYLEAGQIVICLNRGFIDEETAPLIYFETLEKINFFDVDLERVGKKVIEAIFLGNRIDAITDLKTLYRLIPYLNDEALKSFTKEQKESFDLNEAVFTKEVLTKLGLTRLNPES